MNYLTGIACRLPSTAAMTLAGLVPVFASAEERGVGSVQIGSGEVLGVTGSLLTIVAIILLAGFLYSKTRGPRIGGNNVINIVATQPLGAKERIVLVEVAGTQLVVGMTPNQVQTLHVFDQPVVVPEDTAGTFNFAERLKAALRGERQ